jgi:hypothetical protein
VLPETGAIDEYRNQKTANIMEQRKSMGMKKWCSILAHRQGSVRSLMVDI